MLARVAMWLRENLISSVRGVYFHFERDTGIGLSQDGGNGEAFFTLAILCKVEVVKAELLVESVLTCWYCMLWLAAWVPVIQWSLHWDNFGAQEGLGLEDGKLIAKEVVELDGQCDVLWQWHGLVLTGHLCLQGRVQSLPKDHTQCRVVSSTLCCKCKKKITKRKRENQITENDIKIGSI